MIQTITLKSIPVSLEIRASQTEAFIFMSYTKEKRFLNIFPYKQIYSDDDWFTSNNVEELKSKAVYKILNMLFGWGLIDTAGKNQVEVDIINSLLDKLSP